jgi:hypothetical protein
MREQQVKNLLKLRLGEGFQENSKYKSILVMWNYLPVKGKPGTELKGRTSSKNTYQEVGSTYLKRRTQYKRFEENPSDFQG